MEAIEIEKHPNNMNKRDDTSRLPDIWKLALVNRRASVTKTDTRSRRTQDATTFHPHQARARTLPTDETKPPSSGRTTTAPSAAAPHAGHHVERTCTPPGSIGRPQTRSQTKMNSQDTGPHSTKAQDAARTPITKVVKKQKADRHTSSTSPTQDASKQPSNPPAVNPLTIASATQQITKEQTNLQSATEQANHTPPAVFIEGLQLRSRFASRTKKPEHQPEDDE